MTKMLMVSALEFGHPVLLFVLLIAHNASFHIVLGDDARPHLMIAIGAALLSLLSPEILTVHTTDAQ